MVYRSAKANSAKSAPIHFGTSAFTAIASPDNCCGERCVPTAATANCFERRTRMPGGFTSTSARLSGYPHYHFVTFRRYIFNLHKQFRKSFQCPLLSLLVGKPTKSEFSSNRPFRSVIHFACVCVREQRLQVFNDVCSEERVPCFAYSEREVYTFEINSFLT